MHKEPISLVTDRFYFDLRVGQVAIVGNDLLQKKCDEHGSKGRREGNIDKLGL